MFYVPTFVSFSSSCKLPSNKKILNNLSQNNCNNDEICILKMLKNESEDYILDIFIHYKCYLQNNHKDLPIQCAKQNLLKPFKWTIDNDFMNIEYIYKCSKIFVKNRNIECLKLILYYAKNKCISFHANQAKKKEYNKEKFSLPKLRKLLLNDIIKELNLNNVKKNGKNNGKNNNINVENLKNKIKKNMLIMSHY